MKSAVISLKFLYPFSLISEQIARLPESSSNSYWSLLLQPEAGMRSWSVPLILHMESALGSSAQGTQRCWRAGRE